MTQQYLAGELSVLLGRLQAVATNQVSARDAAHLRRQGDAAAVSCQAAVCAELCDFGVCAGFLEEGYLI